MFINYEDSKLKAKDAIVAFNAKHLFDNIRISYEELHNPSDCFVVKYNFSFELKNVCAKYIIQYIRDEYNLDYDSYEKLLEQFYVRTKEDLLKKLLEANNND